MQSCGFIGRRLEPTGRRASPVSGPCADTRAPALFLSAPSRDTRAVLAYCVTTRRLDGPIRDPRPRLPSASTPFTEGSAGPRFPDASVPGRRAPISGGHRPRNRRRSPSSAQYGFVDLQEAGDHRFQRELRLQSKTAAPTHGACSRRVHAQRAERLDDVVHVSRGYE